MSPTPRDACPSPSTRQRMDWNLLRTFMFVVNEGGVGRAALALHLTQPAVSLGLKRLEEAVGGVLLLRRGRDFRLTPLGEEIYAIACDAYSVVSRIGPAARERSHQISGPLRLLVMSRIQSVAYDDFLTTFHRAYPRIEFNVEVLPSSAILDILAQRQPGLGIGLCRTPREGLERRLFLRQRYVIVCGRHHPLFTRQDVTLETLRKQNFVRFLSDQIGDALSPLAIFRDETGFDGRVIGKSSNIDEIRRMVVAGMGLSWLPEHLILRDVERQILRRLPPESGVAEIDVFLLWSTQRPLSQPEEAFRDAFVMFLERTSLAGRTS